MPEKVATQVATFDATEERDVVIGFDLGTACTKVVMRDDVVGTAYAVNFADAAYPGQPYLVPTRVIVEAGGMLRLGDGHTIIDDIKMKLLGAPDRLLVIEEGSEDGASCLEICVGYVALVLRRAIQWFIATHGDNFRNSRILWQLNLGMPSRSYDDAEMLETIRLVGRAGWRLAVTPGPVKVEAAKQAIQEALQEDSSNWDPNGEVLHPGAVSAFPEVIAEVLGYARSELRREGTHLLIDVGAGTVDVSTFILHERDDADRFALLTAEVQPLGAYALHRQRVDDVARFVERKLSEILSVADGVAPLPPIEKYQPIDGKGLDAVDAAFLGRCRHLVSKVVDVTRIQRNPGAPGSRLWEQELPVLLCGGGSRIELYQKAVSEAAGRANGRPPFRTLELPRPSDLEATDLAPGDYPRIAVAYGLSIRADRIGEITPPSSIEDIRLQERGEDWRDRYPGKEVT